jgi:beta-xylosidase
MYMSVNGDNWYSSIVLLTADTLDGDWTYVGPVVYSGFQYATYANAKSMTDLFDVISDNSIPSRYQVSSGGSSTYALNAIDPCVFYDDDGNLWMTYGSWFGGIYMLKLDAKSGLRDYTYTYETKDNVSDAYQGLKLAGGMNSSGEASYIQKIGGYYYLFVTYGGLTSTGGYNMRVFRSDKVTGPYKDESGNDARYTSNINNINGTVGMRLMSYYNWSTMDVAEVAQGHNSAFVDTDGKAYLIYHTRTNDGTEGHYVKVRQLFVNEDGWLVAAPYRYSGETLNTDGYDASQVAGSYEVLMQKQSINYAKLKYVSPVTINLNSNGTVTGAYTGTWKLTSDSQYITVVMGGETYKGVVIRQIIEGTDEDTLCFTLVGTTNEMAVWGSKCLTGTRGIEMAIENLTVASIALDDLELPTVGAQNVQISWKSSNPDVIATDGTLTLPDKDTTVTLTATFTSNGVSESKTYDVKVYEAVDDDADEYIVAKYYTNETIDLSSAKEGTYQVPNPFNSANTSGLEIYNGVAIEFDVNNPTGKWLDGNGLDTILSFMASDGRMYFTAGSYLGFNALGSYFDANVKNTTPWAAGNDLIGKASTKRIRIDILPDGYQVSVDGKVAYTNTDVGDTVLGSNKMEISYAKVLQWMNESATTLNFGWGSWWEYPFQGTISNVVCYAKTVEKVDTSSYVYYQDYKTGDSSEWTSANAADYLTLENDADSHGNYLQFAPAKENSRGAVCTFEDEGQVSGTYTLDFDLQLTAGNEQTTQFAVTTANLSYSSKNMNNGITNGYIFKLSTTNSTTWAINDGTTFTIPKGTWVHITVNADTDAGTAEVKITNGGTVIYSGTVTMTGAGTLNGLYILGGRYNSITCVDNIAIKTTASASTVSNDSELTESNTNSTTETTTTSASSESSSDSTGSVTTTVSFGKGNGGSSSTGSTTEGSTTEGTDTEKNNAEDSTGTTISDYMSLEYTYYDNTGLCSVTNGRSSTGNIKIPSTVTYNGKTYTVAEIGREAFFDAQNLTSVTLPDTIQVIDPKAFMNCYSLTSITIPSGVTVINGSAFAYCKNLSTVNILSTDITIDTTAFNDCSSLSTVCATTEGITQMKDQAYISAGYVTVSYTTIN